MLKACGVPELKVFPQQQGNDLKFSIIDGNDTLNKIQGKLKDFAEKYTGKAFLEVVQHRALSLTYLL